MFETKNILIAIKLMISAVSQRLKLTMENSITTVSKLVGKAPGKKQNFSM